MVIFVARQANIMKSTNWISFSLHASCNTDICYLIPWFLHLKTLHMCSFQVTSVGERQEEDESLIPMFLTELILTVQSLLFEPSLEDFLVCVPS